MRNANTMRPQKYIGDHLLWLITAMLWYRGVLFTAIPGMTVKQSKIILWVSALTLVAFGYMVHHYDEKAQEQFKPVYQHPSPV